MVIFTRLRGDMLDNIRNKLFLILKKRDIFGWNKKYNNIRRLTIILIKWPAQKAPIATFSDCSRIDNLTKKEFYNNFSKMADLVLVNPFQTDHFIYLKEEKLKLA